MRISSIKLITPLTDKLNRKLESSGEIEILLKNLLKKVAVVVYRSIYAGATGCLCPALMQIHKGISRITFLNKHFYLT